MQSVLIITKVAKSIPSHGEGYSIHQKKMTTAIELKWYLTVTLSTHNPHLCFLFDSSL